MLGEGMRQAMRRFASPCQGLEHEGREDLLQGRVAGLWGAPTAARRWRKVTVAQIVVAREAEVARAFGANHPAGQWVVLSFAFLLMVLSSSSPARAHRS